MSDQHDNPDRQNSSTDGDDSQGQKPGINTGNITAQAGGQVNIAQGNIIQNIQNIQTRALTVGETAERDHQVERKILAEGVSALLTRIRVQVEGESGGGMPFKGLQSFGLSDSEIFFGRQSAVRRCLSHIESGPLTVLHAESGTGKSSLLQAGVLPVLIARGHLAVVLRPLDGDPLRYLRTTFLPNPGSAPGLAALPLREFMQNICNILGPKTHLYILWDQFEELFTRLTRPERQVFWQEFAAAMAPPALNIGWVISLRAESLSSLGEFVDFGIPVFNNMFRLERLTVDEARQAIQQPAARHGLSFQAHLVDTILGSLLVGEQINPVHLQLVCAALTEDSRSGQQITLQSYQDAGGSEGILRGYLRRQVNSLPPDQIDSGWEVLRALLGPEKQRVLRNYDDLEAELSARGIARESIDKSLASLLERRLITAHETKSGLAYELVHDYLVNEIEIDPSELARKGAQELLDQNLRDYRRFGSRQLMNAAELDVIAEYRSRLIVSPEAEKFILSSQRVIQRRQRMIAGGIGSLVVLVLLILVAFTALSNTLQEKQAADQELKVIQVTATSAQDLVDAAESEGQRLLQEKQTADHELKVIQVTATSAQDLVDAAVSERQRLFDETGIVPLAIHPSLIAVNQDRLWVVDTGSGLLQEIDRFSGLTQAPIEIEGEPAAMVYAGGYLWIADAANDRVIFINPSTWEVLGSIPVGDQPAYLSQAGDLLWVGHRVGTQILSIDLNHLALGDLEIEDRPLRDLATSQQFVWTTTEGYIGKYDIAAQRRTAERVPLGPDALVLTSDSLWSLVRQSGDCIVLSLGFDDSSRVSIYQKDFVCGSEVLQSVDDLLYLIDTENQGLRALDPRTGQTSHVLSTADLPKVLAFDGESLWIAYHFTSALQRYPLPTFLVFEKAAIETDLDQIFGETANQETAIEYDDTFGEIEITLIDRDQQLESIQINPDASVNDVIVTDETIWVSETVVTDTPQTTVFENMLEAIGLDDLEPIESYPISIPADHLAFDGRYLWLAASGYTRVEAFDTITREVVFSQQLALVPDEITLVQTGLLIVGGAEDQDFFQQIWINR